MKCGCGGYWFPHRKGGGACQYGARSEYYMALRHGVDPKDAMLLLSVAELERMFPIASTGILSDTEFVGEFS